jgi:sugar lactone lactonase YvrE
MLDFRLLKDTRCGIGESPVWDDRRKVLFFIDIKAPAIHSIRLDGTKHRTWTMPRVVGSIGLGASGRLIVALERTIAVFDPESESLDILAEVPGEPTWHRLNDGKVGPDGAFWVGSMDDRPQKEPRGSLYRVDGRGQVTRVLEHVCATISNHPQVLSRTRCVSPRSMRPEDGRTAVPAMRQGSTGAAACPPDA